MKKDKCINCKSKNLEEWAILRNGDTRKEKINYVCKDCNIRFTTEERNY